VAAKRKFTRIPRADALIPQLREAGLGLHVLPTYIVLADHANNRTGRAWPHINTIARITGLCRRTVERHIAALCEAGLVLKNHQRRGKRGRFAGCGFVVVAVLFFRRATVRHRSKHGGRWPIDKRTKHSNNTPQHPPESVEERRRTEAEERLGQIRDVFGPDTV
jgi:hypothetical protein